MVLVIADGLAPRKRQRGSKRVDDYILAHRGICAALIALDLGVDESYVMMRQRKLGVRRLTGTPRMGEDGWKSRAKGTAVNA
jgi:hypothetical protein